MFKNHLNVAVRNFFRHKSFSLINVLGLSIGISTALVIFLIVYYEMSFDNFEKDPERIYRVVLDAKFNGTEGHSTGVPAPLGAAIESEVTGVEHTIPVFQFQGDANAKVSIVKSNPANPVVYKKQPGIVFTNQQYFYLLPYQWIAGSAGVALQNPFTIVLTQSRAAQYFPDVPTAEIIGKQITYNDEMVLTVSGIVKDLGKQTSFNALEFISLPTISKTHLQDQFMMNVWNDWMAYAQLYVKLSKGITVAQTEAQLKTLVSKYNKDAYKDANNYLGFHLQPLNDIHFNSSYPGVGQRVANKAMLYGLIAIGSFLLLLGCINFINMVTAQSTKRAKEIGIRKTMGSSRKQLVMQFLSETFFVTLVATLISVAITPILMDAFSEYMPEGFTLAVLSQTAILFFLLLLVIVVSLLAGIYPALILSGFKPALVLKGQSVSDTSQTRHAWVRKTLTVSQFVIAQFFIIATVMVSKQISYSLNADMGFKKEAIITFDLPRDTVAGHAKQLIHEIQAMPEVQLASAGFLSPGDRGVAFTNVSYAPQKDLKANVQIRWGDPNYMKVYGLKLLAGRNVAASDTMKEFIINDTYAKLLGFQNPSDALDKKLEFNGKQMPIVGVMQDFHDQSFHAPIMPIVFAGNGGSTFHIKLQPNDASGKVWKNAISKIEQSFKQIYPDTDFEYKFYDETIAKLYDGEQRIAGLLKWATGLAIFISCLGLLGIVIFTINTRTKEIGIRKILGASVVNIVSILSKDFLWLVVIAFLIAAPLAWIATFKWMQDYVYRTEISWWVFVLSGLAMLLMALLTLSFQTVKAAIANPVESLRTE
ncbi:ABC transporter permease [soil metagenome]